ncbi:MAG: glycosyltransferase [Bacteroidales bacterium]|nr:glycosyltransferase [Bacteroidales bacterium]
MNILYINSYNCSPEAGGVNRIVYVLSRHFMETRKYKCFIGFYEYQPKGKPIADFDGSIKLSRNFNHQEFETFLLDNEIDVVQINFLKKENLCTIPYIYQIAHRHQIKVLYCLHVCPGFETVTYGSWERVIYSFSHKEAPLQELRRWLITTTKPLLRPISNRIIRKKYQIPYQNCDKVVLLSSNYIQPYMDIIGSGDQRKFEAIGNALTFKEYASEEDIQNKRKQVLMVARFDEFSKRISLALKVWKKIEQDNRLADWTLTLVGAGEAMGFYQYLVQKWNLKRVTFTGHQNPMEYYRSASVFLMTSSAEGWPMTLMEASQMGVPTVAFDSFGALHDIIEDGYNGRIVPNNNLNAFQNALTELMLDEKRLQAMQFSAKESSRNFTIDKFIEKWKKLFEEVNQK